MNFTFVLIATVIGFVPFALCFPFMTELEGSDMLNADPEVVARLFTEHQRRMAEAEPQSSGGGSLLGLPLGGGLIDGVLQPLTGILSGLDIPTPQVIDLRAIPGDDPDHQFQAPGPTDVRGLCPTLNTLANHGYISRDGITSFAEAANAVQIGYGFGYDLSTFLSALGVIAGGDLVTGKYSIGGADDRVPNTLGPALGLDKHGTFEVDASITRQDAHLGNNADFIMQRWEEYVEISKKYGGLFGEQTQIEDSGMRYDNSRATNPQFFAGAIWFAGLPNGTTPNVADYANIAPFFLDERFPHGWFRRGDAFTLPSAVQEAAAIYLQSPRELGGNQGLNNFIPLQLDLSSMTPAQLGCFLLENVLDVAPGQLVGTGSGGQGRDAVEGFVRGVVAPFFVDDGFFNCDLTNFVEPSASAGVDSTGSESASGSPVNGSYPGIGVIEPAVPST